jgi:hypothetical protein
MSKVKPIQDINRGGTRKEHPVDSSLVADNVRIVNTNGTTAVNVFGSKGAPYAMTITGFIVIAKDTTAGNITLANAGSTVAQVAKGTTAGALVGEDGGIANGSVKAGATVTVVSSSAGNAVVLVFYTVDAV